MKLLLPIGGMICTALATLAALVFCIGMGANSTPAQIRAGQPDWAAIVAFAPTVIMSLILGITLLK